MFVFRDRPAFRPVRLDDAQAGALSRSEGLGMRPPPGNPESALEPGMSAPRGSLSRRPARPVGTIWAEGGVIYRQTSDGPVVAVPDPPTPNYWNYGFDPATGSAQATYSGEIAMTGTATLNGSPLTTGAGSVLSFNTRTGAVTLLQADVSAVAVGSFNTRTGAVVLTIGDVQAVGAFGLAGQLPGTATNDNAAAGDVGEYVISTINQAGALALTSATTRDITTISLTAGDWDVTGVLFQTNLTGAATVTSIFAGVSTVAATLPSATAGDGSFGVVSPQQTAATMPAGTGISVPFGPVRFSLNATTTLHFVAQATFGADTMSGFGTIRARRMR